MKKSYHTTEPWCSVVDGKCNPYRDCDNCDRKKFAIEAKRKKEADEKRKAKMKIHLVASGDSLGFTETKWACAAKPVDGAQGYLGEDGTLHRITCELCKKSRLYNAIVTRQALHKIGACRNCANDCDKCYYLTHEHPKLKAERERVERRMNALQMAGACEGCQSDCEKCIYIDNLHPKEESGELAGRLAQE